MDPQASTQPPPRLASSVRRKRSPISLTPLIDVVFILLVFFMLASSFLDWRSIELDAPARAGASASMTGALLVEVRADGLRLSGAPLSLDTLVDRVGERVSAEPDRRVLIKSGDGVRLQRTIDVLDRLTAAGVRDVSLIRGAGR